MTGSFKKASLASSVAALALLLSACSSEGGARLAGIGIPDAATQTSSGDTGSGGSGTGDGSGTTGTGTGTDTGSGNPGSASGTTTTGGGSGGTDTGSGSGGTGSGGTGTGTGTGGTGTTTTSGNGLLGGIITTAGNAVLAVGDTTGAVVVPVNATLPATTPVTGTITNVLKDTGQTLVDVGQGQKVLVSGLLGAVGDAVSISALGKTITSPTSGTSLVGLGVASPTQPQGTLATVGALTDGRTLTATVNGVTNTLLQEVTPGALTSLVQASVGSTTLGGANSATPLINAAVLSSNPANAKLLGVAVLPTNGTTVASANSSAVTGATNGLVGVTVGNTTIGSSNPAVAANVLSNAPVAGSVVTASVPATLTAVGGTLTAVTAPSATAPGASVVTPVSAVLNTTAGTVNAVVTPVVSTVLGGVTGAAGATATTTPAKTGLVGGLLGGKGH